MRRDNQRRPGRCYAVRVERINAIYDEYAPRGLSNREIWRRYIYPVYGCSERTFYNILKASATLSEPTAKQLTIDFGGY